MNFAKNNDSNTVAKTRDKYFPSTKRVVLLVRAKKPLHILPHQDDDDNSTGYCDGKKNSG